MNRKQLIITVLIAFFVGAIGSIVIGRWVIPGLASVRGWEYLNKFVTSSPIVVNRTQEVQLNEGVNLTDLVKQAGNVTVAILDPNSNFLGNGLIVTSDGLIFSSNAVLGKETALTVVTNDGQKFPATIKSKDAKSGLVILSIVTTGLATTQFEPAANLQTAQRVIFLGRSNVKFEHEALAGFVTQSLDNELGPKQITSDVVPGTDYFGGPIIDLSGHVVGMTLGAGQNILAEDLQTALNIYLSQNKASQ